MSSVPSPKLKWDIFCKVVDNFGDIGVCWRLACDLAARGHAVRLWVDDTSALAWLAPTGCPGVEVIDCSHGLPQAATLTMGDVLVDTFGCEFAIDLIASQAINTPATSKKSTQNRPVWLNLEHLTAEGFAQRNHTLPYTHHAGPAAGWTQWYFYPGFNAKTGGLLREKDLAQRQTAFDRVAWLNQLLGRHDVLESSFPRRRESKVVLVDSRLRGNDGTWDITNTQFISLFCYEPAALKALIDQLSSGQKSTRLLVTQGRAAQAVKAILEHKNKHESAWNMPELLSILFLPALTQLDYDHLLWACDLNFVRGEDSLVRAIWAGKPFVWQIYPQHDDAHHHKLNAFLEMMGAPESLKMAHTAWNADKSASENDPENDPESDDDAPSWPQLDLPLWAQSAQNLSNKLRQQDDLATNLIAFVEKNS